MRVADRVLIKLKEAKDIIDVDSGEWLDERDRDLCENKVGPILEGTIDLLQDK